MTIADRERWDAKYADLQVPQDVKPPEFLETYKAGSAPGRALDVACGVGHAAIWLAEYGYDVTAIDVSAVGLQIAARFADQQGVTVNFLQADLDEVDLGIEQYGLITVFRFLDRGTLPGRLVRALRPKGILIYETFLASDSRTSSRPSNPAFLLLPGELPNLFPALNTLVYEETSGAEAMARYIGQKP